MSNFALIPSVLLDDHMLLRMREVCTIVNLLANPGCELVTCYLLLVACYLLLVTCELCTIVNLLANPGCGLNRGRVSACWTLVPSLQCSVRSLA